MVGHNSDVEMLFQDLTAALNELDAARPAPVHVRRAFVRFLALTQQLTAAMRKEFKALTGQAWQASQFSGWNSTTNLFKELRNIDQHDAPVLILVREQQYILAAPGSSALIVFTGTWELHDQLTDAPPEGLQAVRANPQTGDPSDEVIEPVRREFTFPLHPRTKEIKQLLQAAGTEDLHELAHECFRTLYNYVEFFRDQIKESHK